MGEPERNDQLFATNRFEDLDLPEPVRAGIDEQGFSRLTRVQDEVFPVSLEGRDVVAQAQTGSGKTAAYLVTIFCHVLRKERTAPETTPRALIVAPTRELAVQIASDAESLGRHVGLKVHVVFGGLNYRGQRKVLEEGTDLLIGTPGRLIDYHKQGAYSLRETEIVVVDECDRLFDMGFADDLRWLMRRLPPPSKRQSLMFTATLSHRVMTLGWRHMNDPVEIVIDPERLTPDTIRQELYHVASREKLSLLLGLLAKEGSTRTMVFVNTRHQARRLVEDLQRHGFQARGLTGNVVQTKRLRVLDDFREGRLPILVATDVASRGLHIEGVSHVVNYDLPQDPEDYVHRIGRTARAGAEGMAITLACENYVYSLDAVHKYVGYEIPSVFASDDLFAEIIPYRHRERSAPRPSRSPRSDPRRRQDADSPSGASQGDSGKREGVTEAKGESTDKPKRRRRPRRRRRSSAGAKAETAPRDDSK